MRLEDGAVGVRVAGAQLAAALPQLVDQLLEVGHGAAGYLAAR